MSNGCGAGVGLLRVGCHSRLHLRPISLGGGGRSRASVSEGLMGDWWIIGDNAGLGCPSRVEFLAVWDNGDWYASDVERLRLTAGFCSSREARSAACSTAARRCINNLLLSCMGVGGHYEQLWCPPPAWAGGGVGGADSQDRQVGRWWATPRPARGIWLRGPFP